MGSGEVANPQASQSRHLLLGTVSFTMCFAAWGLVRPSPRIFASCYISPRHRLLFWLQFPSCLTLMARIPMGMLTDRFGGRIVFSTLMFFESI